MKKNIQRDLYVFTERAHFRSPSIYVTIKVTVNAAFHSHLFDQTILRVKQVHPFITAVIAVDQQGKAFYQTGKARTIKPIIKPRTDQGAWLKEVETHISEPFDFVRGPLLRYIILTGDQSFDMILTAHHLVGDGISIANLLRDTIRIYAGEKLHQRKQRLVAPGDIPTNPSLSVKLFTKKMNSKWKKEKVSFSEDDYFALFHQHHKEHPIKVDYLLLDKTDVGNLQKQCKEHGLTINSALVTAFFAAQQACGHTEKGKKQVVAIPISIRDQVPFKAEDFLGNHASAVTVKYQYNTNQSFWKNAKMVHINVAKKIASQDATWQLLNLYAMMEDELIDAAYFSAAGMFGGKAAKMAASVLGLSNRKIGTGLSNLGQLDISKEYRGVGIEKLVFFPPNPPSASITVGAATLGDEMGIGISYDQNIFSDESIRQMKNNMMANLT